MADVFSAVNESFRVSVRISESRFLGWVEEGREKGVEKAVGFDWLLVEEGGWEDWFWYEFW